MSKLDGFRVGDRVKTESVGTVIRLDPFRVRPDGCDQYAYWYADKGEVEADTFQITRIEPEIKVYDNVTWGNRSDAWEVVAIKGDKAILFNGNYSLDKPIKELVRA